MKEKHLNAYMKCAEVFVECSKDERLKVGCVIVKNNRIISCGYNGHAAQIDDPNQLNNGNTDPRVRHAEKNALMGLTKINENSIDSVMFCTHACCLMCAIDIVDSGVRKFFYKNDYRSSDGLVYLLKNKVEVVKIC